MADIIEFPSDPAGSLDVDESAADGFLRDEGLDLLAAFRAIKDSSVRASLLTLVNDLARSALAQPAD